MRQQERWLKCSHLRDREGDRLGVAQEAGHGSFRVIEGRTAVLSHLVLALLGIFAVFLIGATTASAATSYAPGTPATFCSGEGAGAGQCEELKGVAVDQSNGHVYAVDANSTAPGNYRISEYDSSGAFVKGFGIGVLTGSTTVAEVCTTTCVKGSATGTGAVGTGARGIVVDSTTHIVYFVAGANKVAYYNGTTGAFLGEFVAAGSPGAGQVVASPQAPQAFSATSGIALDSSNPAQHFLYVATGNGTNPYVIDKFKAPLPATSTPPAYVCQISGKATGQPASECHGTPSKDGAFDGLSLSGQTGASLAVDSSGNIFLAEDPTRNTVSMFDSAGTWVKALPATLPTAVTTNPGTVTVVGNTNGTAGGDKVQQFAVSSGVQLSEVTLPTRTSLGVAIDSSGLSSDGTVYVGEKAGKQLRKYAPVVSGPTVTTTSGATELKQKKAKVSGTVIPNGSNVTACKVEYGLTVSYGSEATCASLPGAGWGAVGVSAGLSGLSPATAYHFRFVATNAQATVSGIDGEFVTAPALAPVLVTEAATGVGKTSATLNGSVNPKSDDVSNCHFEYGPTVAYGSITPCIPALPGDGSSPVTVSAVASGLVGSTTYHFRLVATNSAGTTSGSDLGFETTAKETPIVITAPGATEISNSSARVAGTVNPNGLAVSDCHVNYGTTVSYGSTAPCVPANPGSGTSPVAVTASLSGLSGNTLYHFQVVATNSDGGGAGVDQTFTTLVNPPTVTTTAGSTETTQITARVAGTVNPNLGNVTDCHVEFGLTTSYGSQKPCAVLPGSGSSPIGVSSSLSALTANTTYHFRFVATNSTGSTNGPDQTFTTLVNPPTVTTTAGSTETTQITAKVAGTVNPNFGNVTDCHVDYGLTASYGSQKPCSSLPGSGSGAIAVDAVLTGLGPTTTYHFRFVATNIGGTTTGTDRTFTTFGSPLIAEQSAAPLGTQGAALVAYVNPSGFGTSYHFEWGVDATYGAQLPVEFEPFIGSGTAIVKINGTLGGLQEGVTYHYRVVATNSAGVTQGSDQTFTVSRSNASCPNAIIRAEQVSEVNPAGTGYLPGCMALEMVSPPKKFNQKVDTPRLSLSGDALQFSSLAALEETPQLGSIVDPYVATRTTSGWSTHAVQPPLAISYGDAPPCSYDLNLARWTLLAHPGVGATALGVIQPQSGSLAGAFSPLGPVVEPLSGKFNFAQCEGSVGSADASHLFFRSFGADFLAGDPVSELNGRYNTYEAFLDDEGSPSLELLSRDSSGTVYGGTCGAEVGWHGNGSRRATRGAISPDASRVYFTTRPSQGPGACSVIANKFRIMKRLQTPSGPQITELISTECTRVTPACNTTNGDDNFMAASQEGDKVFFTTTRQLANSDLDTGTECQSAASSPPVGCDLYVYDASGLPGSRLTQISAGDSTDATPGKGAEVLGVADVAGDGSHVYFVATGLLTTNPNAQGARAEQDKPNLYLYERDANHPGGRTAFIATLGAGEGSLTEGPGRNGMAAVPLLGGDIEDLSVGGDGHLLFFPTKVSLTPADTDGGKVDGYRYDSNTGSLERITQAAPGGSDNGAFDAGESFSTGEGSAPQDVSFARTVSEDGRTVVFKTAEALSPADQDGKTSVYLWRDGQVTAIAGSLAGKSGIFERQGETFTVSVSGQMVGFVSDSRLLPADGDGARDVYVARVDGGFAPLVPPFPCDGESCQEPFRSPLAGDSAGSEAFVGPGNPSATIPKCRKGFIRRHGKCKRKPVRKTTHKRHANTNGRAGK